MLLVSDRGRRSKEEAPGYHQGDEWQAKEEKGMPLDGSAVANGCLGWGVLFGLEGRHCLGGYRVIALREDSLWNTLLGQTVRCYD